MLKAAVRARKKAIPALLTVLEEAISVRLTWQKYTDPIVEFSRLKSTCTRCYHHG